MALAADERAHLLAWHRRSDRTGARVRLAPALDALECGVGSSLSASARIPRMNPGRVTRSTIVFGSWQSTQPTGCAPSTCANSQLRPAGDRIRRAGLHHLGVRRRVGHRAQRREALEHVALAEPPIGRDDRRVAVQALARLRPRRHALGLLLVGQHVRVAAPVAVVDRERVAGEHPLEPRIALDLLVGQRLRAAVLRAADVRRPAIAVVLARPVHSPGRGSVVSSFTSTRRR